MAFLLKEGDQIRVKQIETDQIGGSFVVINQAEVVTPRIPSKNLGEKVLDFVFGYRVRVKISDENFYTRVRFRSIVRTQSSPSSFDTSFIMRSND